MITNKNGIKVIPQIQSSLWMDAFRVALWATTDRLGSAEPGSRQLQPKVAQIRVHNNLPTKHYIILALTLTLLNSTH